MNNEELYAKFDKDMTKRTRFMRFLLVLDPTNTFAKAKLEDIEAQIQAERLKL